MFKEYISDENMINMAAGVAESMDPELLRKEKNITIVAGLNEPSCSAQGFTLLLMTARKIP